MMDKLNGDYDKLYRIKDDDWNNVNYIKNQR